MKKIFDKIYKDSFQSFCESLDKNMQKNQKMFIVTANPETIMYSEEDITMKKLLLDKNTVITPDGIALVKALQLKKYTVKERIAGIDIVLKLLEFGNKNGKKVFIFGSSQNVIDLMKEKIKKDYPNIILVGAENGYDKDKDQVFQKIVESKPDIVLVALGIPLQEKLIYKYFDKFDKGIFIGCGGSLDVISGYKKRAPKLFIKLNLEWLYRIVKEPKRMKRFYNSNIKFMFKINKIK